MQQGSVLGPILNLLYTTPTTDIIKAHKVEYHFYADDILSFMLPSKCDFLEDVYLARTRVEFYTHLTSCFGNVETFVWSAINVTFF